MEYKLFEKIVDESLEGLNSYASRYSYDEDGFHVDDGVIIQTHVSDGAEGGNCWGGEARRFINSNPPQDFIPLERILTEAKPDISYLGYKKLEKLIVEGSHGDREYYGNYTNYTTYSLDIRKLYDALFSEE